MIKVLLLSANNVDAPLNIDEEFRVIDAKIRGSYHRDQVNLIKHGAVQLQDIPCLLMRHKPDVVHFSGHGAAEGIELTNIGGVGCLVPPDVLTDIFRVLKDNVRVVVLNACYSAPQAKAIVRVIDCAVGMNNTIQDDAAIAFSAAFYEALGYGRSVKDAFDLACIQLTSTGSDRLLAKLHTRRMVNPSEIILVASDDVAGVRSESVGITKNQVASLQDLQRRFVAAQDRYPREVSFALAMIPHEERRAWQEAYQWFQDMPVGPPQEFGRCLHFATGADRPETVMIPATERDDRIRNCPLWSSVEPWSCWLMRRSLNALFPTEALSQFRSLATDACRLLDLKDCGFIMDGRHFDGKRAEFQHLLRWAIEKLSPEECRKQTWFDPPHNNFRTTWGERDTPGRWCVEMPCVFAAVAFAIERHTKGLGKPWPTA